MDGTASICIIMLRSIWSFLGQPVFALLASFALALPAAAGVALTSSGTAIAVSSAALIKKLGDEYAPDKRTSLWEISSKEIHGQIVIFGETDNRKALAALKRKLRSEKTPVLLQVRLLPDDDPEAGPKPWALVSVPVASFLASPAFTGTTTTQAVTGTPLRILQKRGPFWRAQTPDGYIGWVHDRQIERLTTEELSEWNAASKVVAAVNMTHITDAAGRTLAPLPATGMLRLISAEGDQRIRAQLPDGRVGFVPAADVRPADEDFLHWQRLREGPREAFWDAFLRRAQTLTGISYLWGGTSSAAVDCSGLVSVMWRIAGVIVGRDTDQQIAAGEPLSMTTPQSIPAGVLLAFGKKTPSGSIHVDHVGFSLGAGRFLHALGSVREESLLKDSPLFSAYEYGRYLDAYAFDPTLRSAPCITTIQTNGFFQAPPRELDACRAPQ